MKNKCLLLLIALFIINSTHALSTDMKSQYQPEETAIVKISGNILEPIFPSHVEFKRNNVIVPLEYDLKKINESYFLWFISPLNQNNYTLLIKDISTFVSGEVKSQDLVQNFSVQGNLTDYNIKPGFIFTNKDFEILVKNNLDDNLNINIGLYKKSITLSPGVNKLYFSISEFTGTNNINFNIGKYLLPAYIIGNNSLESYDSPLKANPFKIERKILTSNSKFFLPFSVINTGKDKIEKIRIKYNDKLFSLKESPEFDLESEEIAYFNLTPLFTINNNTEIQDAIYVQHQERNITLYIPISVSYTDNYTQVQEFLNNSLKDKAYYCTELSGKICSAQESCSAQIVSSLDGSCCLGQCKTVKADKGKAWLGYLIAGIALLIIIFLYLKYKNTKGDKDLIKKKILESEKNIL